MSFLPKAEVRSLEEIDRLCTAFIRLGTRKLCLTGGEPLARPGVVALVWSLGRHLKTGYLDELTLTPNGAMLYKHAKRLANAGVKRWHSPSSAISGSRSRPAAASFSTILSRAEAYRRSANPRSSSRKAHADSAGGAGTAPS